MDDTLSVLEGRQVLLQVLLEENGYEVLTATGGKEAVQLFVSNPVDLVLLDYRMPEINGDTATRHMKAHKPDVPIALLLGDEWPPPSALEAADAFISKSELIISFLEKVDYLLSLRLLFQPLEILGTDNTGGQSQHKRLSARSDGIFTKNKGILKAPCVREIWPLRVDQIPAAA